MDPWFIFILDPLPVLLFPLQKWPEKSSKFMMFLSVTDPQNAAAGYFTCNAADFVFAPYGTHWKFMKKLCMSELLIGRTLDQFLPIGQEEINRFLRCFLRKQKWVRLLMLEAKRLASSIIMRMAVSKSCFIPEDDADEERKRLKESAKLRGSFNLSDYFWFFENLDPQGFRKKLKEVCDRFDTTSTRLYRSWKRQEKGKLERMQQKTCSIFI